MNDSDDFQDKL